MTDTIKKLTKNQAMLVPTVSGFIPCVANQYKAMTIVIANDHQKTFFIFNLIFVALVLTYIIAKKKILFNRLLRQSPTIPPVVLSNLVYKYFMDTDSKIPDSLAMPM
jgi:uncharacterized membrane protein